MSLVFAAIIPNNPVLLAETKSDAADEKISTMIAALREFEGELYYMQPDSIVLLTSAPGETENRITANVSQHLPLFSAHAAPTTPLVPLTTHDYVTVDMTLTSRMKEHVNRLATFLPFTLTAPTTLRERVAAPLTRCFQHLPHARTVLITIGALSPLLLKEFAAVLRSELLETNQRVALICSGHLSSGGRAAEKQSENVLDTLCLTFARQKKFEQILAIDPKIWETSGSDLACPLHVFFNVLQNINAHPSICAHAYIAGECQWLASFEIG